MSFKAFLDLNKTCLISAEDAFYKFGKEKHSYFCPNKKCSAKMILKVMMVKKNIFLHQYLLFLMLKIVFLA